MAAVTGSLRNFGLANIAHLNPEIAFIPNKPATGTGGKIFATEPIKVTPNPIDSTFSVALEPTETLLTADVWYEVQVRWFDPAGNYVKADFPDWKIFVPTAGGVFGDLVGQKLNPSFVITSPVAPPEIYGLAAMWLQLDPADPNNPTNPANTGDLYELRNS